MCSSCITPAVAFVNNRKFYVNMNPVHSLLKIRSFMKSLKLLVKLTTTGFDDRKHALI